MAILELRNIYKSYFIGKQKIPVLKGINLDFNLGEIVSILGESGGGKSTLINIIGGLDRKFTGSVIFNNKRLDYKKERQIDEYRRSIIGHIYQSYNLISHLTVLENILVSLDMTDLSGEERKQRAQLLLEDVGLSNQAGKYPKQLSGGQKQRVAIARALAKDPEIIIADEPTGALDSVNTKEILGILKKIAMKGKLVIVVTHSSEVASSGTRIIRLKNGKIDDDQIIRPSYSVSADEDQIQTHHLPVWSSYKSAFKHVKYHFWQNFMIILGTSIGLLAVLLFCGINNGVKGYINKEINTLIDPRTINVMRYLPNEQEDNMETDINLSYFSESQLRQLKKVKHVKSVYPEYTIQDVSLTGLKKSPIKLSSVDNLETKKKHVRIQSGKVPGDGEIVLDKKNVPEEYNKKNWQSIIGRDVDLTWFGIDKDSMPVKVETRVKISGISDGKESINLMSSNTIKKALSNNHAMIMPDSVQVKVDHSKNREPVQKKINHLKDKNSDKEFTAITAKTMLDEVNAIVNIATIILTTISGISLIVAALMIVVSMSMSVHERIKEIGILRALGASRRDVYNLFISESVLLAVLSAILATILAYILGGLVNVLTSNMVRFNIIQFSFSNVVSMFLLAIIIAFFAAMVPARRASNLNTVEALSDE